MNNNQFRKQEFEKRRTFKKATSLCSAYSCCIFQNCLLEIKQLQQENKQLKERIENATERLNTLIEFWKKYNPIDNTMQVEQFKGVINILGGKEC